MSYNIKCPNCNALCIGLEAHQFFPRAGGVILWRICPVCGHKWREGYTLQIMQKDQPWTKPPHLDEEIDDD